MTTNDTSRIGLQRQIDALRLKVKALEKNGKKTVAITVSPSDIINRLASLEKDVAELDRSIDEVALNTPSISRVERLGQDVSELFAQVAVLTDIAHGRIRPVDGPNLDGLAIGVNTLHKIVDDLTQRVDQLEDAIGWHDGANMENAYAPTGKKKASIVSTTIMPLEELFRLSTESVDTGWHPYAGIDTDGVPSGRLGLKQRFVVLTRNNEFFGPDTAETFDWDADGDYAIVAWRYAKAGE